MKTSNKLLLGLIIALFLMVTIFMGVLKYYQENRAGQTGQTSEQKVDELSFLEGAGSRAPIFFPVALLQPLQLR